MLIKVTRTLNSIIEEYRDKDKELAAEITKSFIVFLLAKIGGITSLYLNKRLLLKGGLTYTELFKAYTYI